MVLELLLLALVLITSCIQGTQSYFESVCAGLGRGGRGGLTSDSEFFFGGGCENTFSQ